MKTGKLLSVLAVCTLVVCACRRTPIDGTLYGPQADGGILSPRGVARMLAQLPIENEQLSEVWNAVNSSAGNGYDEEYMMRDLIGSPGSGVGDSPESKAESRAKYTAPLRDLIAAYLSSHPELVSTRSEASGAGELLEELSSSGMQIYWPYSEGWDGRQRPLITFDPGFGAVSNYAYEISWKDGSFEVLDSVYVDENVAASRPVWIINQNDDSGYTPLELFTRSRSPKHPGAEHSGFGFEDGPSEPRAANNLLIKDFTMLRQYDSWFAGASEFFIQAGSLYADYAGSEVEPGSFTPEITQLMVVVRRSQVGKRISFEALLLSGFPEELEQFALLLTESDGGTRTSWKCSAKVMIKSKSYGADLEIPFYTNDDIVWRGTVGMDYLRSLGTTEGRFGDVRISFEVK